jgi:hypothetical protein
MIVFLLIANVLDVLATQYFVVEAGVREANPLLVPLHASLGVCAGTVALKLGPVCALVVGLTMERVTPFVVRILAVAVAAYGCLAVCHLAMLVAALVWMR